MDFQRRQTACNIDVLKSPDQPDAPVGGIPCTCRFGRRGARMTRLQRAREHGRGSDTAWPSKPGDSSYRRVSAPRCFRRPRLPQIQVPARPKAHAEIAVSQYPRNGWRAHIELSPPKTLPSNKVLPCANLAGKRPNSHEKVRKVEPA